MKKMRGVQLTGHGGLDKLVYRTDLPVPKCGPDDVLIKVHAAAINNTDLNTRLAWYSKKKNKNSNCININETSKNMITTTTYDDEGRGGGGGGNTTTQDDTASDGVVADTVADDASWSGRPIVFPRIQGADVCGTVVQIGEHVQDKSLLDARVIIEPCIIQEANGRPVSTTTSNRPWYFGSQCDGGFAEYTVVAARHAYKIRDDNNPLSSIELASFPCSYSTAENMLTRARVNDQDTVLITGASGGVGSAAVQLAKARGATVIAVTSPSKASQLMDIGADRTIDRGGAANLLNELKKDSVSVVVDLVAGPDQWPQLLDVLKPFGRYVTAGAIAGPHVVLDVRTLYLKDLTLYGCTVLAPDVFGNLVRRIEDGQVKPLVSKVFDLKDIAAAQTEFASKRHVGKLVLRVAADEEDSKDGKEEEEEVATDGHKKARLE